MSPPHFIKLSFDDASHETIGVSEVAPGQFRLHETSMLADPPVYLGDLIEARPDSAGGYRFQRMIERSGLRVYSWLLCGEAAESPELAELGCTVRRLGGETEQLFGGLLILHLPSDAEFEVETEVEAAIARARLRSAG